MCGNPLKAIGLSPDIPKPPPPPVQGASAPDGNAQAAYDEQRRSAAAAGGRSGSIKTSSDLETQDPNTASRQLLG